MTFLSANVLLKAQLGTVAHDKPLGFLNPALQNYDMDKGIVSLSTLMAPINEEEVPLGFLAIAEFKPKEEWRIGVNASQVENRLRKISSMMLYSSYRLELEKGNYLIIGVDVGAYGYTSKAAEFNKVFNPNQFTFGPDNTENGETNGLDVGLGIAYSYQGFTLGIDFSKLNRPAIYPFPRDVYEFNTVDSVFQLKDTSIAIEEGVFGLQNNINVMYQWDANTKLKLLHSLHLGNVDATGADFIGFQNIAEINNRHSIGLGAFYSGRWGFNATAGYGFTENIKFQVSSFFLEENVYNTVTKLYESQGYKPTLEFNIRYEF